MVYDTDSMVGDVNLFFNDSSDVTLAEVEVMVAGNHTYSNVIAYLGAVDVTVIKGLCSVL